MLYFDLGSAWRLLGTLIFLGVSGLVIAALGVRDQASAAPPERSDLFPDTEASRLTADPDKDSNSRLYVDEQFLSVLFGNAKFEHNPTFSRLVKAARIGLVIGVVYIIASIVYLIVSTRARHL